MYEKYKKNLSYYNHIKKKCNKKKGAPRKTGKGMGQEG